jgi:beta-lactamase class A
MDLAGIKANAEAEMARIAARSKGVVGVAARHMAGATTLGLNADQFFPMASTVKVPLALSVLAMIDRGAISLSTMIEVQPAEMNPSGPLGDEFLRPGIALSVQNLIEPMITRSDNTATDVLFRLAGGPEAVARDLQAMGITEIRPSRSIRDLLVALYGLSPPAPDVAVRDVIRAVPPEELAALRARGQAPSEAYVADPRDQATPRAMLDLLARTWRADGISQAARDHLLDVMGRTTTGVRRIAGRLPQGTKVADKTGSASGTTNDVGFITLPDGSGTVALAVFVKSSPLPVPEREEVVADIGRLVYDAFLLTAPTG